MGTTTVRRCNRQDPHAGHTHLPVDPEPFLLHCPGHTGQLITIVDQVRGKYQPSCRHCGWHGKYATTMGMAQLASAGHRRTAGCAK